jgi:hypothetical protein
MPIAGGVAGHPWSERSIKTNAPAASGVYAIFNATTWLYVGESDDIRSNLLDHLGGNIPGLAEAAPTGFSHEELGYGERTGRYAYLVKFLTPKCNKVPFI